MENFFRAVVNSDGPRSRNLCDESIREFLFNDTGNPEY